MSKLIEFLKGKKSYLCAIGLGLVVAAEALGYITKETADSLKALLGAGAIAALRAAK
jgi:hypothetical protein